MDAHGAGRNEVLAREGIDTKLHYQHWCGKNHRRNEVLAREGIDTLEIFHSSYYIQSRNEVLAREGIDTKFDYSSRMDAHGA